MGHPKDASGCHCVLSLCHLMYCHLPNISPWRLRRFPKSKSHLITTYPATALCTWRIQNHQTTFHRGCSFTHSASDHPPLHSLSSPPAVSGAPWPPLSTASTAAPAARSCSTTAVWPSIAAPCSGVQPQAPKGLETSTAGSTPWLSTAHPHTSLERLESVEWSPWVSSFPKLYSELAQWQPLSLLVFVKIIKTTNWWILPQQKIRKRDILRQNKTYLNISQAFSSSLPHPYSRPIPVANVEEFFFLKMS